MPFTDPIVGGNYLLIPAIRSPNYVAGASGWTINRDGTAEFADGTFRGAVLVGTSPNPRINLTTTVPAALQAAYSTSFIITAIDLWYYNATDFFFNAVGLNSFGDPEFHIGGFISGTLIRYEIFNGKNTVDGAIVFYGSEGNGGSTAYVYRKSTINLLYNGVTGHESLLTIGVPGAGDLEVRPTQPIVTGIGIGSVASASAVEVGYPFANWTKYPTQDIKDGHVFKATVDCQIFTNVAGSNAANLRLRQGTAPSVAGTLLAEWVTDPTNAFQSERHYERFFYNNTGVNISRQDFTLGWVRGGGANTLTIAGDASHPLVLNIFDYGLIATAGVPVANMKAMT